MNDAEYEAQAALLKLVGEYAGHTLTYSNNHGGWSMGEPYTKTDIEFDPLTNLTQAVELAAQFQMSIHMHDNDVSCSAHMMRYYVSVSYDGAPAKALCKAIVLSVEKMAKDIQYP